MPWRNGTMATVGIGLSFHYHSWHTRRVLIRDVFVDNVRRNGKNSGGYIGVQFRQRFLTTVLLKSNSKESSLPTYYGFIIVYSPLSINFQIKINGFQTLFLHIDYVISPIVIMIYVCFSVVSMGSTRPYIKNR